MPLRLRFSIFEFLWIGATLSVGLGVFFRIGEGQGIVAWTLSTLGVALCSRASREAMAPGVRAAACMTAGGIGAAIGMAFFHAPLELTFPATIVGFATGLSHGLLLARRQAAERAERPSRGAYLRTFLFGVFVGSVILVALPIFPWLWLRLAIGVVIGSIAGGAICLTLFLGSRFAATKE